MKQRNSAGFTMLELLVVLAIIALIVTFALPKFTKSIAKTKLTDAVQALGSGAAQVESTCATKNTAPDSGPDRKAISSLVSTPSGYNDPIASWTGAKQSCVDIQIKVTPKDTSELPTLCIVRESTVWKYGFGNGSKLANDLITNDDLPVPSDKIVTKPGCL